MFFFPVAGETLAHSVIKGALKFVASECKRNFSCAVGFDGYLKWKRPLIRETALKDWSSFDYLFAVYGLPYPKTHEMLRFQATPSCVSEDSAERTERGQQQIIRCSLRFFFYSEDFLGVKRAPIIDNLMDRRIYHSLRSRDEIVIIRESPCAPLSARCWKYCLGYAPAG